MHLDAAALDAGLPAIRRSPADEGTVEMIVRRPDLGLRECLDVGELSTETGLVGDTLGRPSQPTHRRRRAPPGHAAQPHQRPRCRRSSPGATTSSGPWPATSSTSTSTCRWRTCRPGPAWPSGTAVIEVTDQPHTGCAKFRQRFGAEAHRFVTQGEGADLRLRGINAKVVQPGTVCVGDVVRKL